MEKDYYDKRHVPAHVPHSGEQSRQDYIEIHQWDPVHRYYGYRRTSLVFRNLSLPPAPPPLNIHVNGYGYESLDKRATPI